MKREGIKGGERNVALATEKMASFDKDIVDALAAGKLKIEPANEKKLPLADELAAERAKQKLEAGALPALPTFAEWSEGGKWLRIKGDSINEPTLLNIYRNFWKALSVRAPQVAIFLGATLPPDTDVNRADVQIMLRERETALLEMSTGWFSSTCVRTPLLYALLQGPFGEKKDGSPHTSGLLGLSTTIFLNRYYRAVTLLITDAYGSRQESDKSVSETISRAIHDRQETSASITVNMQKSLKKAIEAMFEGGIMTQEKQREKTTDQWVEIYRRPLEDLVAQVRLWTITRLQLHEAMISQLMGLPADEGLMRALATSVDPPKPEEIEEKRRSDMCESAISSIKLFAEMYEQIRTPTHRAEGVFTKWLLDEQLLAEDIRAESCRSVFLECTAPLAYYWVRICAYSRISVAQEEYDKEYRGTSPLPAAK